VDVPVQFLHEKQPMKWSLRPEISAHRQFLDDRPVGGGQRIRHRLITGKSIAFNDGASETKRSGNCPTALCIKKSPDGIMKGSIAL